MNIALWTIQILLALHTAIGAAWKLSNAEGAVPSLAIPHTVWVGLAAIEILASLALLFPLFKTPPAFIVPIAAAFVAVEMFGFVGLHLSSGDPSRGPVVYWLVVAAICALLAYSRYALAPH